MLVSGPLLAPMLTLAGMTYGGGGLFLICPADGCLLIYGVTGCGTKGLGICY